MPRQTISANFDINATTPTGWTKQGNFSYLSGTNELEITAGTTTFKDGIIETTVAGSNKWLFRCHGATAVLQLGRCSNLPNLLNNTDPIGETNSGAKILKTDNSTVDIFQNPASDSAGEYRIFGSHIKSTSSNDADIRTHNVKLIAVNSTFEHIEFWTCKNVFFRNCQFIGSSYCFSDVKGDIKNCAIRGFSTFTDLRNQNIGAINYSGLNIDLNTAGSLLKMNGSTQGTLTFLNSTTNTYNATGSAASSFKIYFKRRTIFNFIDENDSPLACNSRFNNHSANVDASNQNSNQIDFIYKKYISNAYSNFPTSNYIVRQTSKIPIAGNYNIAQGLTTDSINLKLRTDKSFSGSAAQAAAISNISISYSSAKLIISITDNKSLQDLYNFYKYWISSISNFNAPTNKVFFDNNGTLNITGDVTIAANKKLLVTSPLNKLKLSGAFSGKFENLAMEDQYGQRLTIQHPHNFNLLVKVTSTDGTTSEKVFEQDITSITYQLQKGDSVKLAAWQLGKKNVFQEISVTSTGGIFNIPFQNNSAIDKTVDVNYELQNISLSFNNNAYTLFFDAMNPSGIKQKAIVHRLAGRRESLQAAIAAGKQHSIEIRDEGIFILRPVVFLKRKTGLAANLVVDLTDGYINVENAKSISNNYVLNPYGSDNRRTEVRTFKTTGISFKDMRDYFQKEMTLIQAQHRILLNSTAELDKDLAALAHSISTNKPADYQKIFSKLSIDNWTLGSGTTKQSNVSTLVLTNTNNAAVLKKLWSAPFATIPKKLEITLTNKSPNTQFLHLNLYLQDNSDGVFDDFNEKNVQLNPNQNKKFDFFFQIEEPLVDFSKKMKELRFSITSGNPPADSYSNCAPVQINSIQWWNTPHANPFDPTAVWKVPINQITTPNSFGALAKNITAIKSNTNSIHATILSYVTKITLSGFGNTSLNGDWIYSKDIIDANAWNFTITETKDGSVTLSKSYIDFSFPIFKKDALFILFVSPKNNLGTLNNR